MLLPQYRVVVCFVVGALPSSEPATKPSRSGAKFAWRPIALAVDLLDGMAPSSGKRMWLVDCSLQLRFNRILLAYSTWIGAGLNDSVYWTSSANAL
jgi:hypothetical protein